jgi:hypothetical protein
MKSHGNETLNQHFHIKSDSSHMFCLYIYPCVAYVINDAGHGGGPPKAVRHGRQDEKGTAICKRKTCL